MHSFGLALKPSRSLKVLTPYVGATKYANNLKAKGIAVAAVKLNQQREA
jgi:hypothetical protein